MRDLGYSERLRAQKRLLHASDRAALGWASWLLTWRAAQVRAQLRKDYGPGSEVGAFGRAMWADLRAAVRACTRPATDRLEWRGRCHRLNGRTERVEWPGGKATRHTVHLRERARCLLMGRDYPIAGPSGWLP